jgi:hypothetical protein
MLVLWIAAQESNRSVLLPLFLKSEPVFRLFSSKQNATKIFKTNKSLIEFKSE